MPVNSNEGEILESSDFNAEITIQNILLCSTLERIEMFGNSKHLNEEIHQRTLLYKETINNAQPEEKETYIEDMTKKINLFYVKGNSEKAEKYKKIFLIAFDDDKY